MFAQNQERVYQQMDGIRNINNKKPNAKESKQFWSNIWDNDKEHERNTEWLRELRAKKGNMKQNDINITTEMIKEQVKKISNWKSPGSERVQGSWLKTLTTLHERITLGKTIVCQKEPSNGNAVDNYIPISSFSLMWMLMPGTIAESIDNILDLNDKLLVEKKGCRKIVEGPKINYYKYKSGNGID